MKNLHKNSVVIMFGAVLVLVAFVGYRYYAATQFTENYDAYAELAETQGNAAFLPAVSDNPLRKELNRTLERVLSDTSMSNVQRLTFAERGTALLKEAENQIDDIGTRGEGMETAIEKLEASAYGGTRKDIVQIARERMTLIADIRGLSYRANYHTAEIFTRIIKDGGKLTDAHVLDLNTQIPAVEEQFDRRQNLYRDLESANHRMEKNLLELSIF